MVQEDFAKKIAPTVETSTRESMLMYLYCNNRCRVGTFKQRVNM